MLEEVEEEGAEVAVELDHAAPRRAIVVDPLRKRPPVAHVPPAAVLFLLARHRVLKVSAVAVEVVREVKVPRARVLEAARRDREIVGEAVAVGVLRHLLQHEVPREALEVDDVAHVVVVARDAAVDRGEEGGDVPPLGLVGRRRVEHRHRRVRAWQHDAKLALLLPVDDDEVVVGPFAPRRVDGDGGRLAHPLVVEHHAVGRGLDALSHRVQPPRLTLQHEVDGDGARRPRRAEEFVDLEAERVAHEARVDKRHAEHPLCLARHPEELLRRRLLIDVHPALLAHPGDVVDELEPKLQLRQHRRRVAARVHRRRPKEFAVEAEHHLARLPDRRVRAVGTAGGGAHARDPLVLPLQRRPAVHLQDRPLVGADGAARQRPVLAAAQAAVLAAVEVSDASADAVVVVARARRNGRDDHQRQHQHAERGRWHRL